MSNTYRKKKVLELKKQVATTTATTLQHDSIKNIQKENKQTQTTITSISLKNLLSEKKEKVSPKPELIEAESTVIEATKTVSENEMQQAWNDYAEKIKKENPQLFSILAHRKPILSNSVEINVQLVSQSQEVEFRNEKENILSFLRNKLENSQLTLSTTISDNNNSELDEAVTASDKLKAMVKKNPALDSLRIGLNLEIE